MLSGLNRPLPKAFIIIILTAMMVAGCATKQQTTPPLPGRRSTGAAAKPPVQNTPGTEKTAWPVRFRTLVKSEMSLLPAVTVPTLFVSDSRDIEQLFRNLVGGHPDVRKALKNVDTANERILAVMFGRASGGGHAITIREIAVRPGAVMIRVQIDKPEPNRMYIAAEVEPVHMVAVPTDDLQKAWKGVSQVVWTVIDTDGNQLLEVTERRR